MKYLKAINNGQFPVTNNQLKMKCKGYTVLEILVAFLLISIIAAIVIGRYPFELIKKRRVYTTAHRVATDLRYTRRLAVANYASYTFKFYDTNGSASTYEEYKIYESDENNPAKYVTDDDFPSTVTCTTTGAASFTYNFLGNTSASTTIFFFTGTATYTVALNDVGSVITATQPLSF